MFFKLLNNAVYGKTIEKIEKRKSVYIVTKWKSDRRNPKEARAHIAQLNFHSISSFDNDMFAVQSNR